MRITKESYDKLLKALEEAREANKEIVIEIEEARKQGDLSENADYSAAMDKKRGNDALIADLEHQIYSAEIVGKPTDNSKVAINCRVTIEKLKDHSQKTYIIGDSISTNPDVGVISETSPLGKAMVNHVVGDVVNVETKVPYAIKILSIDVVA